MYALRGPPFQERLNQIQLKVSREPRSYPADVHFLLSLLDSDSQTAGTFVGPCVSCGHNNYDSEQKECKQRWMEGNYSVVCGCPCAKHNSLANAATTMRDKCVSELLVMKAEHIARGDLPLGRKVFDEATKRLSSLTLDQVEQEKQQ